MKKTIKAKLLKNKQKMEKLTMCRICLVENVRMYEVVNKSLQELYEKLTDISFVTEDNRPMLACFFCYAKLKQCYQLQRKCLQAEELFAQMLNENYEQILSMSRAHSQYLGGFVKTAIENISILDAGHTESEAIEIELPAVCERQYDVELKEEPPSDELRSDNIEKTYPDVKDVPPHRSESDSEDDMPLMVFKIELEGDQVCNKKPWEIEWVPVAVNTEVDTRRLNLEVSFIDQQQKAEQPVTNISSSTLNCMSRPGPDTEFKEPSDKTVNIPEDINGLNTATDTSYCNNSEKDDLHCKILSKGDLIEKPYKCDICQRNFSKFSSLKRHIPTHTGEKPFKCEICKRSFNCAYVLKKHVKRHNGEKPYKCTICERRFNEQRYLKTHFRTHSGEKPFNCDICKCSFSCSYVLKKHIRKHTGEKPFKCDICQLSFNEKRYLTIHNRIHTGEKPYKCEVCQCSFSNPFVLKRHILIHTGEKPHKCDICQHSFIDKRHLTNHIRTHTGEKPYKCEICQREFSQNSNLSCHMRTHGNEKPHKCNICHRGFSQKRDLNNHIRIHTGETIGVSRVIIQGGIGP